MATKKTPAKKSSSSSTTTTKSPTKTTKKQPAKKSSAAKRSSAPRASSGRKRTGLVIAGEAAQQLVELTGREVEGVTGLERSDDGWTIQVEVLEVRRIPETTDLLALYELNVDEDGDLEGYRRIRRYVRGTPGEESS